MSHPIKPQGKGMANMIKRRSDVVMPLHKDLVYDDKGPLPMPYKELNKRVKKRRT